MKKAKKQNLKNDEREEINASSFSDIDKSDLEVDEKIDDKYTNSVFNKYKNGHQKNHWFTCSASFFILIGIIAVVTMVVVGLIFISSSDALKELAVNGDYDYEAKKTKVIICCILIPIIGIFSILIGLKINSFANLSKDELSKKVGKVMLFSFLQFIFGGTIFAFLTIIGYFMGIGSDYGAIYYNRIEGYNSNSKEKQLHDAKIYHQNQLIDDEEYKNLKENILKDKEIYF